MKHTLLICVALLGLSRLPAQSFSPVLLSNAGGYVRSGAGPSLCFALGELAVTAIGTAPALAQGFFYSAECAVRVGLDLPLAELLALRMYPNPAGDWLQLRLKPPGNESLLITLYDLQGRPCGGRLHFAGPFEQEKTLDLSGLSPGMYLLRVAAGEGRALGAVKLWKR